MTLGPVEILVIAFPGNRFNGEIIPELAKVVENGTMTIIDELLVRKDADGEVTFSEIAELGANDDVASLARLVDRVEGLISDEDVAELTLGLDPDSSAAIIVFEHSWVKPLRDSIVGSGGVLLESIRVPGAVVEEILASVPDED